VRIPAWASPLLLFILLLNSVLPEAQAREGELQFIPRLGIGRVNIEQPDTSFERGAVDTFQFGLSAGYRAPFGLVLEGGIDSQGEVALLGLFDTTEFFELYASIGVQLDFGDWRLVPKVGASLWSLDIEPGLLADSPTRPPSPTLPFAPGRSGTADFFEVSLSRRVAENVTFGVNYRDGEYDFGRSRSLSLMISLGFK